MVKTTDKKMTDTMKPTEDERARFMQAYDRMDQIYDDRLLLLDQMYERYRKDESFDILYAEDLTGMESSLKAGKAFLSVKLFEDAITWFNCASKHVRRMQYRTDNQKRATVRHKLNRKRLDKAGIEIFLPILHENGIEAILKNSDGSIEADFDRDEPYQDSYQMEEAE